MTEILIYGEIGGPDAHPLAIRDAVMAADNGALDVRIHSPGGSVLAGEAILSSLQGHPAGFNVTVEGSALSMAAVIAISGQSLTMRENGFLMFHETSIESGGTADDLRNSARLLDKMDKATIRLLHQKTGLEGLELVANVKETWWIDGEEALALGLANAIIPALEVAAFAPAAVAGFDHVPQNLPIQLESTPPTVTKETATSKHHERITLVFVQP